MTSTSNGVKDGSGAAEKPLFGGLWVPTALAVGYVYTLYRWSFGMRATLLAGVDPFKATAVWPSAVFTVLYLASLYLGKQFMASRQPYNCKNYMFVYNLYQVLINVWCVAVLLREVSGFGEAKPMVIWGNRYDPTPAGFQVGFVVWVHYNNKFAELLDTLWMLLRKKNKQISFLHVYHHCLMMWAWLYVCKIECGGDAWFGACINSFIHIIMYLYYFLAQIGVPCPWKRYLTMAQILQFCLCIAHAVFAFIVGNAPIGLPLAQTFVMLNMLVLFSQFYMKSYRQSVAAKKTA